MFQGMPQNSTIMLIKKAYHDLIISQEQRVTFWVLTTFLPAILLARLLVYTAPQLFLNVDGTHVHHLTYGIILLTIAGYAALVVRNPRWRLWIAALYGVGLALAFDEFGMWLRLQDNYWVRQSYDAVLIILAALINTVYFAKFWLHLFYGLLSGINLLRVED